MRLLILILFLSFTVPFVSAKASELDNESAVTNKQIEAAKNLPATVVIRVNTSTKALEVLHSGNLLAPNEEAVRNISASSFASVQPNRPTVGELDREGARSSFYFFLGFNPLFNFGFGLGAPSSYYYSPYAYIPTYYYSNYAYNYYPYYSYGYGPYNYYFYRWWF